VRRVVALTHALGACSPTPPSATARAPAAPPSGGPAPAQAIAPAPLDGGDVDAGAAPSAAAGDAGPPCTKLRLVDVCEPPPPVAGEALAVEALDELYKQRGARRSAANDPWEQCYPVKVGPSAEDALACTVGSQSVGPSQATMMTLRLVIRSIRDRRVVTLASFPYLFAPLVMEVIGFSFGTAVKLGPTAIEVSEPREGACREAHAALGSYGVDAAADRRILDSICKAVGVYEWRGGVYVKR
jgi:hypothetical protein